MTPLHIAKMGNFININRDQIYVTIEREILANQICIIEILQCYLCWVKISIKVEIFMIPGSKGHEYFFFNQ